MVKKLKTFNLEEEIYNRFSNHCKSHGISMSKQIENFLKSELENLKSQRQNTPERSTDNHRNYIC